ncbi:MAG: hypothetical protein ACE5Q6_08850 [Dehalococcoidia bacterium]
MAYGDTFELGASDATKLIQLRSDQVMWQKERLLNVALLALPPECKKVAWVDCDILFERDDWPQLADQALDQAAFVQCFSQVHHLNRTADVSQPLSNQTYFSRESMGARYLAEGAGIAEWDSYSASLRAQGLAWDVSLGHAWAMRLQDLRRVGFYDALILGGGDGALTHAALGRFQPMIDRLELNAHQTKHYLQWAEQFHRMVKESMSAIPGDIYHLWHGELRNRNNGTRHSILPSHNFDPNRDIAISENGCWRWNSDKPDLHDAVRAYFQSRNEDGR